eukprot:673473-Rhodomonas_salina.3
MSVPDIAYARVGSYRPLLQESAGHSERGLYRTLSSKRWAGVTAAYAISLPRNAISLPHTA